MALPASVIIPKSSTYLWPYSSSSAPQGQSTYFPGSARAMVGALYVGTILVFDAAADVATAMGAVTTVIGTLVGAFFGFQLGSADKEKAEDDRKEADALAKAALAEVEPGKTGKIYADARNLLSQ